MCSRVLDATASGRRPAQRSHEAARARHGLDAQFVDHREVAVVDLDEDAAHRRFRQADPLGDVHGGVLARSADHPLAQLFRPDAPVLLHDAPLGDRPAHLGVDQQPVAVEDHGARPGAHARATSNAISTPSAANR